MKILIIALLTIYAVSLTVEINNIHYGFRNIYVGNPHFQESLLKVSPYNTLKNEVDAQDTPFLTLQQNAIAIDFSQLVRSFYLDEINPQQPQLMFRYFDQPSIIVTIFSEQQREEEIKLLNKAAEFGRDISELDL